MELLTVPVVLAIVQMFKIAGLPSRLAPLASLAIGLILGFVFVNEVWTTQLAAGLILGLSASGLYSGGKAVLWG